MKLIKHIPNFFTSLNLFCGCLAIVCAFHQQLSWSAYLLGIAAVFDFVDGLAARVLKAHSEIGKQLDSMADLVTFGVVPGIILFQMISSGFTAYFIPIEKRSFAVLFLSSLAFLVPIFSAIRLAKFNLDERQKENFIGLPTPANAIFIASFVLILEKQFRLNIYYPPTFEVLFAVLDLYTFSLDTKVAQLLFNPYFLIGISVVMSLLLVSELPMFSMKFKSLKWKENKIRYLFILISAYIFYYYAFMGIPLIILIYLVLSVGKFVVQKLIS